MDWTYDGPLFHGSGRSGTGSSSSSNASTLQAAVGAFSSIASRTLRHPVESLESAAKTVLPQGLLGDDETRKEELRRIARRAHLLQKLSHATCWADYSAACLALDQIEGAESWKSIDDSELYDVAALRHRLQRFRSVRDTDDVQGMLNLVRCELTRDLAGICNPELHKQTRMGTKFLIDDYVAAVHDTLDRLARACAEGDPRLEKMEVLAELDQTRRSYGRTALLLSGGGTYGMSHIGVIKALYEANALPRIISGSSSGSIVASVLGCTPDAELIPRLEDFCNGDLAVFIGPHERQGWTGRASHFSKTGHLFDLGNLRRVMVDLLGKTTFLEAYNRTRRVLNIAVTTSTKRESQQILNYATAGNVVIWSAVVASCAVPLGFEPERLLYKSDSDSRSLLPWDPSTRYIDGSVHGDLPSSILSAQFDVNHSLASQVNPHVAPVLKLGQHENIVSQLLVAFAGLVKLEAINLLGTLREHPLLDHEGDVLVKLSSVLTQRYDGDITLLPVDFLARFWTILRNPTPESMKQSVQQGQQVTWSMLSMIKTHMNVEMLIDDAVRRVSEHVAFSKSASDLRKLYFQQSKINAHGSGGRLRSRRAARHRRTNSGMEHFRFAVRDKGRLLGEDTPPSSDSGSSSSCDSSEDDDEDDRLVLPQRKRTRSDAELTSAVVDLFIQTQPNTPSSEHGGFFDASRPSSPSSRPTSPTAPPMSLWMTPVTPRSVSPEASHKFPPSGSFGRPPMRSKSPSPSPDRSRKRRAGQAVSVRDFGVNRSKKNFGGSTE